MARRRKRKAAISAAVVALSMAGTAVQAETDDKKDTKVPVAKKIPHDMTIHGDTRTDDYYWLRDDSRTNPEVLDYLKAENEYSASALAHTVELQEDLYEEMVGRIKQADQSVPYKKKDYWYSTRYEEGHEFPVMLRNKGSLEAPDEILLDTNMRAAQSSFYSLGGVELSSNQQLMAFAEDTLSRRMYDIRFKDLRTGKLYPEVIAGTSGCAVWANDNKTVYYVKKHPETLLPYQVYKHTLGTDPASDPLIYEETDPSYYTSVHKTASDDFIVIGLYSTTTSEALILDANDPNGQAQMFKVREKGVEYSVDHFQGNFLVKSNKDGKNFGLYTVAQDSLSKTGAWKILVEAKSDVLLQGYEVLNNWLVVEERVSGLIQLRQISWQTGEEKLIQFNDPAYTTWLAYNPDPNTDKLRFGYTSMTTPVSTLEVNLATGERETLKQQQVMGDFSAENYKSERVWVEARDGTKVPVSLVYRKDKFKQDGSNPILLYAYGSYGATEEPGFSSESLSMLDRGFVYAIAHVRGGEELGRDWYEDGKLKNKKNTFYDFIDVTQSLVTQNYADKDKVFAMGGSAGGLLMGAVVNLAPELYQGVVAQVPFVDVVTTMLDESIPLTTGEYDEWGNPNEKGYYDYMKSYSPYDQVAKQSYPNMLVTTGLHDSQVQYWEPAKWVAKLRDKKTDDNLLLLDVDMEAGHGGKSGRFKQYQDTAKEYAFILDLAGVTQ